MAGWLTTLTLATQVGNDLPPIAPQQTQQPRAPNPLFHIGTPIPPLAPGAPRSNRPGTIPPLLPILPP